MSTNLVYVKTVDGIEIRVDQRNGQFVATIGKREVRRRALRDLEKLIDDQLAGVPVLLIPQNPNWGKTTQAFVVRLSHDGRWLGRNGVLEDYRTTLTPFDEDLFARCLALEAEYEDLQRRWHNLYSSAPHLTPERFAELQAQANDPTTEAPDDD